MFAAVIVATDPIAVVGLFKSLGAPKRLLILVEGESLLNDGTAVVLFTLRRGREIPADVLGHLEREYQEKEAVAEKELATLKQQSTRFHEEEHQEAIRRVLIVEKESLLKAYHSAAIGKEAFERLSAELDERIAQADAAESHTPSRADAPVALETAGT